MTTNKRDKSKVASFIDGLRTYVIDERDGKFVAVMTWKESPFDPTLLRRKTVTQRDDASDPFDTREEAEAFIAKRIARSKGNG